MNILYFHPHFMYPGGAGKFVLETGERLAKMGHNVTVLAQSGDEKIIKDYPSIHFRFIGGPLPNTISHWIRFPILMKNIFEVTKGMKIDIIFPQVFPANYWGFLFKIKHPEIPCIWFCHEPSAFVHNYDIISGLKEPMKSLALISNPLMKLIDRYLSKYPEKILTNSKFTSNNVTKIYNRNSDVVYPGVDISKFKPSENKENFIFTIGRLTKFKRVGLILEVMARLKGEGIHLYIGGDGEERENLVKLAKILGISEDVTFLGKLSESQLNFYYSKAKVVIFPTFNEPFGIVPLESMASGTPVIATNSGGVAETIINEKTGFLVSPDNVDEIIVKVKTLLLNEKLCNQMSKYSREHIESNFSWDATTYKLDNLLKRGESYEQN